MLFKGRRAGELWWMAATRSICPLDLEHILQYSITGWSPGCSGEESQLLHLLKDGFMNNVVVTKIREKQVLLTFPKCMLLLEVKCIREMSVCLSKTGKPPCVFLFVNQTKQEISNLKKTNLIWVFMLFRFVPCSPVEHMHTQSETAACTGTRRVVFVSRLIPH